MKKKKLKKRIKKLEEDIKCLKGCHANLNACYQQLFSRDQSLMDAITNLEKDNKYYKEWMDRSGVDYKSWFEEDLKSCSNCYYNGWSDDVAPCYGCTDTDKKMFKPKEENNGN